MKKREKGECKMFVRYKIADCFYGVVYRHAYRQNVKKCIKNVLIQLLFSI